MTDNRRESAHMDTQKAGFSSIDQYIATFPEDVQARLEELRSTIRGAAPGATERISYGMPAFVLNGNLVYFAAWKNHIGFYAAGSGLEAFQDELSRYKMSKGAIQFPNNEPLPLDLISRIVQLRVAENQDRVAAKGYKK